MGVLPKELAALSKKSFNRCAGERPRLTVTISNVTSCGESNQAPTSAVDDPTPPAVDAKATRAWIDANPDIAALLAEDAGSVEPEPEPPPRRFDQATIDRAKCTDIESEARARGVRLVGRTNLTAPCPNCGGDDRFWINTRKQIFDCRRCGVGGDVIALVMFVDGCNFVEAVKELTGEQAV